jgi:hypothetical protein
MNKNIAVPITSKLQVIEGDEQAKAWVAKDESTPSPLPFQRRVIYEYMDSIPKTTCCHTTEVVIESSCI